MSGNTKYKQTGYSLRNRVRLVQGGRDYFETLLELIRSAKESIHLQTYIFAEDETGSRVIDALQDAAARRVQIYLLVDGYGSRELSRSFMHKMKDAGIHFRFFDPILRSKYFYFGRRLHHKLVVVDGRFALVGGINITNRYNDLPNQVAWLDFAILVQGQAAQQLCVLCWKTWNNFPVNMPTVACETIDPAIDIAPGEICEVKMCRNDWVRRKNDVSYSYVQMIMHAQSEIILLSSYFLPGSTIRRHLAAAARRGVRIRVVTTGISDVRVAKYAERYLYNWLLKNNIELYEYQPTVLHGKIAVCDGQWVTIGSYNINNISAYASIELNMNVRNKSFAGQSKQLLEKIIDRDCIRITPAVQRQSNNPFRQLAEWVSHSFVRLTFYLFTFYFKHKH